MMLQRKCGIVLPFVVLLASGCERENKFVPPPPPRVSVAQPLVEEIADAIEFIGNTRASATVELRARVNGYLEQIEFKDGAIVSEGDLLFVIDEAPFQVALDITNAELQRAEADLQLAQTEYRRTETLVARQAQTQADLDQRAAELATAEANIAAAQAAVRRADLDLNYSRVRAPISGRIGRHLVDRGNLVQAEQTLLATIERLDPIHAYFNLSESDLLRFMEMQRQDALPNPDQNPPVLFLGLANDAGYPQQGYLDFREVGVDSSSGTALRRGRFPNPNNELLPGLFVRIRAPIGEPQPRLLVEKRALGADQRGDYLLVVNDKNVVEYRLVELGLSTDGMRVVEEGVEADDWIVVNGLQRARPGATVNPEQVAMTMGPTAEMAATPAEPAQSETAEGGTPTESAEPTQPNEPASLND